MRCPKCQSDTKVLETRTIEAGLPKRRRECLSCSYRFNTLEILEDAKPRQEKVREEKPKPKSSKASRPRQVTVKKDRQPTRERDDWREEPSYADDIEELGIDIGRGPEYF